MRHEILPYRPISLIPPHMVRVCLRSVLVVSAALALALVALTLTVMTRGLPSAYGAELDSGAAADPLPSGLFFRTGEGDEGLPAPALSSDVTMAVNVMVNRVTVRQVFHNPTENWLEAVYVFPLPERSAVDRLTMTIGERRVEGRILEKAEAKRAYEAAAENGQRASLVSGERPNVFVTSLANIGPGEDITVEIGYQDAVAYDAGVFSLRFPMVVAPRYSPAPPALAEGPGTPPLHPTAGSNRGESDTPRDLFGPVNTGEKRNPLSLAIVLDAGMELQSLRSLHHPVVIETGEDRTQQITLRDGAVLAERDFVLEWMPEASAAPRAAIFAEQVGEDAHLLVMMLPPTPSEDAADDREAGPAAPRELVLIIDTSGSMHGDSLAQAKISVIEALKRLNPQDRFNVVQFNNVTHSLFKQPVEASVANVARAFHYVSALQADGGTEMAPALEVALTGGPGDGHLSQIVFLTDGAVGNELALFQLVADRLGESRLFTVGIGSAPNSYFMRKAAELGRGSFTHIGKLEEVESRMDTLFRKLENPALTDIRIGWPNAAGKEVETYPLPLPDLYDGQPVTFSSRLTGVTLEDLEGQMLITGKNAGQSAGGSWQQRLALDNLTDAPGTASLWARAKLVAIEERLHERGEDDPTVVRAEALALALEHQLVTRYTSLVAVDEEVARPEEKTLDSQEIERNLPAGWDAAKVFGEAEPLAAAPPLLQQMKAFAPLSTTQASRIAGLAVTLPQTATPAERKFIIGLAYLLLGLGLLALIYRRSRHGRAHGRATEEALLA